MTIEKSYGEPWGASISFTHTGEEMIVDVGWCAQMGERYLWCAYQHNYIPAHWEPTVVTLGCGGIWRACGGVGAGDLISCQAVVCPDGALDILPPDGETPKMDSHLADVRAIAERVYRDVYKIAPGGITGIEAFPG